MSKSKLPRYPWDEWFAKKRFKLVKGRYEDYQCKTHGMAAQIRNAAHLRHLSVSLSIDDNSIEVEVRDSLLATQRSMATDRAGFIVNVASHELFSNMTAHDRKVCARITESAIRLLCHRTGAIQDAFAPRRRYNEFLEFLGRHPRLLRCVKHIHVENSSDGRIQSLLPPGYAAGLMYLQAVSKTDPTEWHKARKTREENETMLDFSMWPEASDFWVEVARLSKDVQPIRDVVGEILEAQEGISVTQKWAVICKAWQCLFNNEKISAEKIRLVPGEATPVCGGIDLGNPTEAEDEEPDDNVEAGPSAGKEPKTSLNRTMVKCLKALKKLNRPATMEEIATKAGMKYLTARTAIGSIHKATSIKIAKKYHPNRLCLLDTGMVRAEEQKDGPARRYVITNLGIEAIEEGQT